MKFLFLLILIIHLSGCGYKPSAKYVRAVTGEKITTSVIISETDPENSVLIKDAVDKAIIEVFHASLVDKEHADTFLSLSIDKPIYTPLQYNKDGFIVAYRATITLHITRRTKDVLKLYATTGNYDFSVLPNSVLSDQERFDAIKYSSIKAIASFVARVSAEGSNKE